MALYWRLRRLKTEHSAHIAQRLLELREGLREQVTEKDNVGELKVATWNLMHFGGGGGYKRSTESLQYIAEIIDHFDLVSIQEVKRDIKQLKTLLKDFLGDDWDYIVSDTTEGDAGNDERMAVLYRKERVRFSRVAGEIVLPPIKEGSSVRHPRQLARTPYYLGFQAGWFKFKLCSVHIHYGAKDGDDRDIRIEEIDQLAKQLKTRSDDERKREVKFAKAQRWDTTPSGANYILLGDFNIHKGSKSKDALTDNGFEIPDDIDELPTNTGKNREPFDQIAVRIKDTRFKQGAGGVFDFRDFVYLEGDSDFYRSVSKTHVEKLKAREKTLKGKPKSLQAKADKKRKDAAAEVDPGKAAELSEDADKLEAEANELAAKMQDPAFLEDYLSQGIKDYFVRYYRKNQMSDHLLLWTSFKIDYADDYLKELAAGGS